MNYNCTLIQEYITNEARRSMNQLNVSLLAMYPCSAATPDNLDNRTRWTSYLDAEAIAIDGHSLLDDPMAEPSSNRSPNELPDNTTTTPSLTYSHNSPDGDTYSYRYDNNLYSVTHSQLDYDMTAIHQWPLTGAKFG